MPLCFWKELASEGGPNMDTPDPLQPVISLQPEEMK